MKNVTKKLLVLTTMLVAINDINATEIEFHIQGIQSSKGKLYIQLFDGANSYAKGKAINARVVKAEKGEVKVIFSVDKAGEYALRYFHDENNNGKLETNLFGIPTEGYGYSNSAKPAFGPVKYEEAKFTVGEQDRIVTNHTRVIY